MSYWRSGRRSLRWIACQGDACSRPLFPWLLCAAAALLTPGAGADGTLSGGIDQAGNISGPTGTVAAGTYDYQVSDTATVHNYHLEGPGVNQGPVSRRRKARPGP